MRIIKEGQKQVKEWQVTCKKCGCIFVFDDSDASYDIMVEKENMLYKHFNEKLVKPYIKAN